MDAYKPLATAQLARLTGLADCPADVTHAWVSTGLWQRCERGERVIVAQSACDALWLVVEGVLITGRQLGSAAAQILGYHGPGELYGLLPLADGGTHPLDVMAHESALVLRVPRERVMADLAQHEGVRVCLHRHLAQAQRQLTERLFEHASLPLAARVTRLLHQLAAQFGVRRQAAVRIGVRLSQDNIARTVGASRQQVNAVLRSFVEQGLVSVGRESITLHDALVRREPAIGSSAGGGASPAVRCSPMSAQVY